MSRECAVLYPQMPQMSDSDEGAQETDFMESDWFAANIDSLAGHEKNTSENEDAWVCPLCSTVDGYENFEGGVCDECFKEKMHDWAVECGVKLDPIIGADCGEDNCPCMGAKKKAMS